MCVEWEINFLLFMLEEPCSHLFFNFPSVMFIIIRRVSGLDKEERKNTHTHFDTFIHQTESVFLETDGAEWKMFGQHKILWQSRWAGRGPRCRLAATHTHTHLQATYYLHYNREIYIYIRLFVLPAHFFHAARNILARKLSSCVCMVCSTGK